MRTVLVKRLWGENFRSFLQHGCALTVEACAPEAPQQIVFGFEIVIHKSSETTCSTGEAFQRKMSLTEQDRKVLLEEILQIKQTLESAGGKLGSSSEEEDEEDNLTIDISKTPGTECPTH